MGNVFQIILTTSVYASIVGMVIILLKRLLKNRLSPKYHYLIWIVLIVKLLMPFGPQSAFSLFNAVPQLPVIGAQIEAIGKMSTGNPVDHELLESKPLQSEPLQSKPQILTSQPSDQQTAGSINDEADISGQTAFSGSNISDLLGYLWLIGLLFFAAALAYSNYSLHTKLRKGQKAPSSMYNILRDCQRRMDVGRNIEIIVQHEIKAPSLFGVIKPKILISPGVLEMSDEETGYIFLHELAHFQRKDVPANYLLLGLQLIHWFNPLIWYFFRIIRQDMEVAADQRVLSVLNTGEEKEYGRALLSVLEKFDSSRLVPKLIGMVDEKQNIERRITMIRMSEFFRKHPRIFFITGILCIAVLAGVLLTGPLADPSETTPGTQAKATISYDLDSLLQHKNPYIGNASNVGNLIQKLPYGEYRNGMSLQTEKPPYGLTVKYDFTKTSDPTLKDDAIFRNNAIIIFSLIDNVDTISNTINSSLGERQLEYSRSQLQRSFVQDLREYSKSKKELEILVKSLNLNLHVFPQKYTSAMSSTPGIMIAPLYSGKADKAAYAVTSGGLLQWNQTTGKIYTLGSGAELGIDTPIYWTPLDQKTNSEIALAKNSSLILQIIVSEAGVKVAEKQLHIQYDGTSFYSVEPAYDIIYAESGKPLSANASTIEQAVSQAIRKQALSYRSGEAAVEGHIILEAEEKDGLTIVYTIASTGNFGFENGIFTKISGSGSIPTVITFSKNEQGKYALLKYQEPMDGAGNLESIRKMFPQKLWPQVLSGSSNSYPDLVKQQENQAAAYLQRIGRNAPVQASYVQKTLSNIPVEASNKLFSELTKYDSFLNDCPYWIGSREIVQDGVRYIYETAVSKTEGYDVVTFRQSKEDGTVVKEKKYKIVGNEPQLVP